ncbi:MULTISPECIES: flippase [unclassified Haladaptatus]|uniref:flippase n=1 Tax=unclassified Haladaptatus TaxID=2622732 RepID=UPI00209BEEBA|nr:MULTISPECIES: flippase [unclassified Haladaptatus]MCO8246708.1 flippase [Haladaptatus sp. AB643]MCO8256356.1 flippase [Haladaptatus sp. AB618]
MTEKVKKISQTLASSGAILFGGMILQLSINFGSKLLIARTFGKVDYGGVSLGITLMTMVTVLTLAGTDTGIGRYLPRFEDDGRRRGVLLSGFQIVLPFAFIAGCLIFLFSSTIAGTVFNDSNLSPIIRAFGFAVPFMAFVKLTIGSVRGLEDSLPKVYLQNIAVPVSRFGMIIGAILLGLGAVGIAWSYALSYGIAAMLCLYYLYRRTPLLADIKPVGMHKELLVFSAPIMITATMNMILSNIDIFMLGVFSSGTGDIGIYNSVYPIAAMLAVVLTSFGFIFMPIISKLHSNGDFTEMRRMYQVVSKWVFLATVPLFLVLVLYPDVVIRNTFGAEYSPGALTLALLSIGFLAHAVAGPAGNALTSIGKTKLIMVDNITVAMVNVALNLVLIPKYSYFGAAIATTAGYLMMNSLYLIQLYRTIGIHPFGRSLFRTTIAALVAAGIAYGGSWILLGDVTLVQLIGAFVLFCAIYLLLIVVLGGIEEEELALVEGFENRFGVNLTGAKQLARRVAK